MTRISLFLGVALLVAAAGCGGGGAGTPGDDSGQPTGDACTGTGCEPTDAARDGTAGQTDAPPGADAAADGARNDAPAADAPHGEGGANLTDGGELQGALSDYLPCTADQDCPVGYGDCVTVIPFNRRDADNRSSVTVASLDSARTGVCSLACSTNPDVCATLTIRDERGTLVPYQCQLVAAGTPPYPSPRPAFPFDTQLVAADLVAGQAFGALCRPPFGVSTKIDDAFCKPCTSTSACGTGVCWSFSDWDENTATGAGACLVPCSATAPCAFGFTCSALTSTGSTPHDFGQHCVPIQMTCGLCRDLDGDGRGLGRCGPTTAPVTPYDCDDADPRAYYDPAAMSHPFPQYCGDQDLNCNGISDAVEQIGQPPYATQHCAACNSPCDGAVPHGALTCQAAGGGGFACVAACTDPAAYADCDGDAANGCETAVTDPTRLYYRDADGDGYGAGVPLFSCSGSAPAGYVSDHTDCDDTKASVHPGAAETCNGVDDNCNGTTDDSPTGTGGACLTGQPGRCAAGTFQCQGGGLVCVRTNGPAIESCNGIDDDCDGTTDNVAGGGDACDVPGKLGPCKAGKKACIGSALGCAQQVFPAPDEPDVDGTDSNCDGIDGDESKAIFVDPLASDTYLGTKANPVQTIGQALTLANASTKPHIYLLTETYVINDAITLKSGVSIYGGFARNTWTRNSSGGTVISRTNAATGAHLIGVQGSSLTATTKLQDVIIEVPDAVAPAVHVYGLVCKTCPSLKLVRVAITIGNGGVGTTGTAGTTGAAGVASTPSGNPSVAGTGAPSTCGATGGNGGQPNYYVSTCNGHAGYVGSPSPRGGAGGAGGTSGTQPGAGGAGTSCLAASTAGTAGSVGTVDGSGTYPVWVPVTGGAGGTGCAGGGGGGSGGGVGLDVGAACAILLPGGLGGSSGGCGGTGGGPGAGGGSSIGVLLWQSSGVTFQDTVISAGAGGAGGAGGVGGVGGAGAPGLVRPPAADGGHGANGAGGGGGGGGPGGNAYAILKDASTGISSSGTAARTFGSKGTGGAGGAGGIGGTNTGVTTLGATGATGAAGPDGEAADVKNL
ncbi:MAG TPA: putative metal-binding motif-containing protein [Polyangia bacterium]